MTTHTADVADLIWEWLHLPKPSGSLSFAAKCRRRRLPPFLPSRSSRPHPIPRRIPKRPAKPPREVRLVGEAAVGGHGGQGLAGQEQVAGAVKAHGAQVVGGGQADPAFHHLVDAFAADAAAVGDARDAELAALKHGGADVVQQLAHGFRGSGIGNVR